MQDEDPSLLSGLTNLTLLGLSHNRIANISPLAELTRPTKQPIHVVDPQGRIVRTISR